MSAPISPPARKEVGEGRHATPELARVLQLRSLWHRAPNAGDRSLDRDRPLMEVLRFGDSPSRSPTRQLCQNRRASTRGTR
jgi:hypothetical protein